jgi:hypothetical protein
MTRRYNIILASWILWLTASSNAWSFYNPNTGRWLNRDPIAELGSTLLRDRAYYRSSGADPVLGIDLSAIQHKATEDASLKEDIQSYAFTQNDAIDVVDQLGLMRIHDLFAKLQARKQGNANIPCCCYSPKISGSIRGMWHGGATVTAYYPREFTDVFFLDPCIFDPEIYWWDCYSASEEGGRSWNWGDYGWNGPGAEGYSKTARPNSWSRRDPYHIAILSIYVWDECIRGERSTKWAASNELEWTWDKKGKRWTGPDEVEVVY